MRRRWLIVGVAGVAVASSLVIVSSQSRAVNIPAQGPWTVRIATDPSSARNCAADEAVEAAIQTASAPSAGGSFRLADDATRSDVERVVDCVTESIASSLVSVVAAID